MPIYLKLDGIPGEVTEAGHEGWIAIASMQFGMGRGIGLDPETSHRHVSRPSLSEVTVSKLVDAASVKLFLAGTMDEARQAVIEHVSAESGRPYLTYTLHEVLLSGYSVSSGAEGRPAEHISLNFRQLELRHVPGAYARDGRPGDPQTAHHAIRIDEG